MMRTLVILLGMLLVFLSGGAVLLSVVGGIETSTQVLALPTATFVAGVVLCGLGIIGNNNKSRRY